MMDNQTSNKIIVIIPAYCEEKTISSVIDRLKLKKPEIDILVIDDGSSDNTAEVVVRTGSLLLRHPYNMGYGCSLETGYIYATENNYQYIVQIDADNQHDPDDIDVLLLPVIEQKSDLVIGSRFIKPSYKIPIRRKIGIRFFNFIIKIMSGLEIKDCTSGYQAMNHKMAKFYCESSFPIDYPDANVLMLAKLNHFRIMEVPVHMNQGIDKKSMHAGLHRQIYYIIVMLIYILISRLRGKYHHVG